MVIATLCAALDKVWPLAIKAAIDLLVPGQAERNLIHFDHLCVLMVIVVLVKQVLDSYRSYQTDVLNAQVTFRLRKRLFHRLIGLSLGELSAMKAGGITSRLSGDVDSASGLIQMALISPGVADISVLFTLIILTWMNWRLAVVALVAIPPLALSSYFWTRKVRPIYRSIREDRSEIDGRVNETFGGIRVVRSFRRESREERTYAVGHHATIRKGLYAERLQLVLTTIWGILIPGVVVLIVAYGGHLVARDKATVGQIVAFQIYAMMLLQPIWQIVSSISQTQRALAAMERVFDVLNTPLDKPDVPDAIEAPTTVQEIRFDKVLFQYRDNTPVLYDFTLKVPRGATVAASVGPSGAGKTTLTDLVARFNDPTQGAIYLNNIDLRRLRLREYRKLLAVVQQDVFLFDGSVADNIAYGRRHVKAFARGHRRRRPSRHQRMSSSRGFPNVTTRSSASARIQALWRATPTPFPSLRAAILANPQILILDEATSNLDTESEQLIPGVTGCSFQRQNDHFVIAASGFKHGDPCRYHRRHGSWPDR